MKKKNALIWLPIVGLHYANPKMFRNPRLYEAYQVICCLTALYLIWF